MEKVLRYAYTNILSPAYLGSIKTVYDFVRKKHGSKISLKMVKDFLNKQETYGQHKPVKRKFARNKYIPLGMDSCWEVDLVDVTKLAKMNGNNKFLLTVIDIFSKYAWVVPVKNKTSGEIIRALAKVLKSSKRKPWAIRSDAGGELINASMNNYLYDKDIKQYVTRNTEIKAAVIERYNRSLREIMWKHFYKTNSNKYLKHLPKLVKKLNNRYHKTIGMKPSDVTWENEREIWKKRYGKLMRKPSKKFGLEIGDRVKLLKHKGAFTKGYEPKFGTEIFTVCSKKGRNPPVYRVKDKNGEKIIGTFYERELLRVYK
jgi:hypothetical protein